MDCLSANMAAITEFSARISGTLQDQHAQITKLSGMIMKSVIHEWFILQACIACRTTIMYSNHFRYSHISIGSKRILVKLLIHSIWIIWNMIHIIDLIYSSHESFAFYLGVHTLLRKLQFLFELPARLNKCLELQAYAQAVSAHRRARCVLQQYSHMPSFRGIQDDCHVIMEQLAQQLRQKFRSVVSRMSLHICIIFFIFCLI